MVDSSQEKFSSRLISVIVICFNEERYLEKCLKSLVSQDYPREMFEVIVVDNGSTDRSLEIARKYADKIEINSNVRVGELRNIGAGNARGELLAFLDGDCEPDQEFLNELNRIYFQNPNTINGSMVLIDGMAPWVPRAWFCGHKIGRLETSSLGAGNFSIPKEIFISEGGFNRDLTTGEDSELFCRLAKKYKIYSDSSIKVIHHGVPLSIASFFRREIWHGLGAFGSFQVNWLDKPLIATFVFLIGLILTLGDIIAIFFGNRINCFSIGLLVPFFIIIGSLVIRRQNIRSLLHSVQLSFLFFVYYFARSISLIILLLRLPHPYYKRDRD